MIDRCLDDEAYFVAYVGFAQQIYLYVMQERCCFARHNPSSRKRDCTTKKTTSLRKACQKIVGKFFFGVKQVHDEMIPAKHLHDKGFVAQGVNPTKAPSCKVPMLPIKFAVSLSLFFQFVLETFYLFLDYNSSCYLNFSTMANSGACSSKTIEGEHSRKRMCSKFVSPFSSLAIGSKTQNMIQQ